MRAQDINLSQMLDFQPEHGRLMLNGRRMLIMSQRSLGLMAEQLSAHLGHDHTRAVFAQFGYRCGQDDYAAIADAGEWDTDADRIASGPVTHMWEGLVHVEPTKLEFDRAGGHFHMTGIWRNSYEAENHLRTHGVSTDPVCASLTGYASGWGTAFFGRPLLAIETMCQGKGDPHCAFEVRPESAWGAEADPWRAALVAREESIAHVLESRVETRTRDLDDLRRALDLHALVSIADRDGRLTFANDRLCAVSGYRRDELVGREDGLLNDTGKTPEFIAAVWDQLRQGKTWHGELCHRTRDGSEYWMATTIMPLADVSGAVQQFISLGTDITARRLAEASLVAAREAADRANRAKSEFLAMMSHEIRTPMNGVLGFTNLLMDTELSEEQRQFVTTIQSSGESLLTIINDILDFSKVETGQLTLESIQYDLPSAIDEIVELLQTKTADKGLRLEVQLSPDLPKYVRGDPGRVRQVLLNLASNAVKFTAHGHVRLRGEVAPDGRIRLLVEDTGIGLKPEQLPRMFKQFSQADSSTTRRFGGTGLGLAISKRLVELMGGEIGVESKAGHGTTFWFTLPAPPTGLAVLSTDSVAAARAGASQPTPTSSNKSLRVLVAEDNPTNQFLAKRLLSGLGCVVDVAGNGREAVDLWSRLPYDLIFMDCHMPEMDGMQATVAIRQQESAHGRSRVTIVACTASAMADEREACRASGMDDFVAKPVLREQLQRCIEARRRESPAARPG